MHDGDMDATGSPASRIGRPKQGNRMHPDQPCYVCDSRVLSDKETHLCEHPGEGEKIEILQDNWWVHA
jgi:hypothetical protein